jgi:hypothetical protein
MKQKKQKTQPARVSKPGTEALGLPDRVSASQRHFLKVAAIWQGNGARWLARRWWNLSTAKITA